MVKFKATKPANLTTLVSINDKAVVNDFIALIGVGGRKSLLELNAALGNDVVDYETAWTGGNFPVLTIVQKNRLVTVPFSKNSGIKTLEDARALMATPAAMDWTFYAGNQPELDEENNPKPGQDKNPTGLPYVSFGKPQGLTISERQSFVEAEPAKNPA